MEDDSSGNNSTSSKSNLSNSSRERSCGDSDNSSKKRLNAKQAQEVEDDAVPLNIGPSFPENFLDESKIKEYACTGNEGAVQSEKKNEKSVEKSETAVVENLGKMEVSTTNNIKQTTSNIENIVAEKRKRSYDNVEKNKEVVTTSKEKDEGVIEDKTSEGENVENASSNIVQKKLRLSSEQSQVMERNRKATSPQSTERESRPNNRSPAAKKHDRQKHDSKNRSQSRERSIERRRKERKRRHEELETSDRQTTRKEKQGVESAAKKDTHTQNDPKEIITERQRRTVDLLTSRTGGAYIPPAKLRLMQAEITDKSSAAYQRIAWEALKKSIHGYINKVNVDNIAIITRELLKENVVRGRGLLCRSIIQAQAASPTFTHVYAALVSIINSKFPNIGELLLKRLVIQFKRAFRRNDKNVCLSSSRFIAHLVNQRVAHEILALELLTLLVETPTDDSVEVAIAFLKESGMKLTEVSSKGIGAIFEMLKNILHEGKLDKRVQYMIEVVFQVRKDGFKDHQSVLESLELVEEDDQFTHLLMLDEATNPEDALNAFKFDDKYETNEDKYKGLSKEILGSEGSDSNSSDSDSNTDSSDDSDAGMDDKGNANSIIDNTETNMIALRRTIYLTINSSLDYEECAHKLMKLQLKPGQEIELCHMFLDCCAEQRTYEKFYGLLAQRFCAINKIYIEPFEEIFKDTYQTTHRLDTNRLRNVSKFFAHLLFTDAIAWDILECIKLNEDDTTSSSRIFIKILFQELAEYMGLGKLNSKLKDEELAESLTQLFPKDNPRNTRFSINFFTSIGLGGLTDDLRNFLKNAPKVLPAINVEAAANEDSSESSSSPLMSSSSSSSEDSSSSSSSSSSTSDSSSSDVHKKKRKYVNTQKSKKNIREDKLSRKHKTQTQKKGRKASSENISSTESSSDSESSDKLKKKKPKKAARKAPQRKEDIANGQQLKKSKRSCDSDVRSEIRKRSMRYSKTPDRNDDRKNRERRYNEDYNENVRYNDRSNKRDEYVGRHRDRDNATSYQSKHRSKDVSHHRNGSKERG